MNTIPKLWNAINFHHDQLGRSLSTSQLDAYLPPPRRPRVRIPPRAGGPPPRDVPTPPVVDRPPVTTRSTRGPLCRRACNHVRAICYAARRICRLADHLQEERSQLICRRAQGRCRDAHTTAQRRCPRCAA